MDVAEGDRLDREEVARLRGYEAIPRRFPWDARCRRLRGPGGPSRAKSGPFSPGWGSTRLCTSPLRTTLGSSFLLEADIRRRTPRLANPLAEDAAFLRGDGVGFPAGYVAAERVQGRGPGRLFEVTTLFSGEGAVVTERVVLAGLIAGEPRAGRLVGAVLRRRTSSTFGGAVEGIAAALERDGRGCRPGRFRPLSCILEGKRGSGSRGDAGSFGEIHPDLVHAWELFQAVSPVRVGPRCPGFREAGGSAGSSIIPTSRPLNDLAVMVDAGTPYAEVRSVVSGVGDPKIESFFLFDQDAGAPLPPRAEPGPPDRLLSSGSDAD